MLRRFIFCIFAAFGLLLFFFPKLDILFTNYFYRSDVDFIYQNHPLVVGCFRLVPIITTVFGVFCLVYIVYSFFYKKTQDRSGKIAIYLLIAAILGPGLLVNFALKNHVGRARPKQVLEFGGNKAFIGPLRLSDECELNCSFSSGHAAMGYYFSSLSYVTPPQYQAVTFLFGIVLGSVIGFGRVLQGGHFLSDVVFSGIFIMLTNHICFIIWRKIFKNPKKPTGRKVTSRKKR
ncbi:MAG: phosphatase PAP2 family protein [Pseudomonadota bacterium]